MTVVATTWAEQSDMASHYGMIQTCCGASFQLRAFSDHQIYDSYRCQELLPRVRDTHYTKPLDMDSSTSLANETNGNANASCRQTVIKVAIIHQAACYKRLNELYGLKPGPKKEVRLYGI